jgi:hypothetical protein
MTKKQDTQPATATPAQEVIPPPPGGGRWKWDGKQWISLDEPTEQPTENQE